MPLNRGYLTAKVQIQGSPADGDQGHFDYADEDVAWCDRARLTLDVYPLLLPRRPRCRQTPSILLPSRIGFISPDNIAPCQSDTLLAAGAALVPTRPSSTTAVYASQTIRPANLRINEYFSLIGTATQIPGTSVA
jgi:hypothetical protein